MFRYELVKNKKLKTFTGNSYICNFEYKSNVILEFKLLPKKFFLPETKEWEIPADSEHLEWIKMILERYYPEQDNEVKMYEYTPTDKKELLKDIKLPKLKTKLDLFDHQKDAIKYGLLKNSFLLGDEMGLGKTASIIHYAIIRKNKDYYKKCLIVTGINGLKYNWFNEVSNHSYEKAHILGMRKLKNKDKYAIKGTSEKLKDLEDLFNGKNKDIYFYITNIESLRIKSIAEMLEKCIEYNKIQMVVLDEAQVIKNPSASQTKSFLKLRSMTRVAMTGTPIMNNPIELYGIFNWLGLENHNFYQFKQHYAIMGGYQNYQIVGYKNLEEIQQKLDDNMIRRLKCNVLNLPEKLYHTEYLEMDKNQLSIYNEIKENILIQVDKIKSLPNPITAFLRLRQATCVPSLVTTSDIKSAKIERLIELAKELKANKEKFIVFSIWSAVIDKVEEILSKEFKTCKITGDIKASERMSIIDYFNSEADCILGTIGALGTGFNLTKASTIIFLDSPWNKATKNQAEDRCFTADTKILTPEGYLLIKDLNIGDNIYGGSGKVRKIIDKWSSYYNGEYLLEIEIWGNREKIKCTPEHKFQLFNGEWVEAKELKIKDKLRFMDENNIEKDFNDVLYIPQELKIDRFYNNNGKISKRRSNFANPIKINDEFLFFCGYYIGDGFTFHNGVGISGNRNNKLKSVERCVNFMKTLGYKVYESNHKNENAIEYRISSKEYKLWFEFLFGKGAKNKKLPYFVYNLSKRQLLILLEGLSCSDGYIKNNILQYATTSQTLLSNMIWLLSQCGYYPSYYISKVKKNKTYYINAKLSKEARFDFKTNKIKNISKIYLKEPHLVYDITVEEDNTFLTGINVVHNCHRIGMKGVANIITLVCKDTIDERIEELIYKKGMMSDVIVDFKVDLSKDKSALVDLLLS